VDVQRWKRYHNKYFLERDGEKSMRGVAIRGARERGQAGNTSIIYTGSLEQ
jgi:hypothetical protein